MKRNNPYTPVITDVRVKKWFGVPIVTVIGKHLGEHINFGGAYHRAIVNLSSTRATFLLNPRFFDRQEYVVVVKAMAGDSSEFTFINVDSSNKFVRNLAKLPNPQRKPAAKPARRQGRKK